MGLLDESGPAALTVQKLSIERIAREAGVSRTTIYRWWPSKAAVVIDSFLENHVARTPVREDVPAIEALREHFVSLAEIYAGQEGRLVAQLIAECQHDRATMVEFKERFWTPRSRVAISLIERAVEEGSLRGDLDPMLVAELLYTPLYSRLLLQTGALDAEATGAILQAAFEGLSAGRQLMGISSPGHYPADGGRPRSARRLTGAAQRPDGDWAKQDLLIGPSEEPREQQARSERSTGMLGV